MNIRVLGFATQGVGGDDESRLRALLTGVPHQIVSFDRLNKKASFAAILREGRSCPTLFVMEGTGFGGGFAILLSRVLQGTPFVVSSGDAVAPFLSARFPAGKPLFYLYERLLYSLSSGFIGWTPYLVGRALTMGAPMGATAAGWAPFPADAAKAAERRAAVRSRLRIPEDAIVFGIAGSLVWSSRKNYCYGAELVRAALHARSSRACVLIVGDGSGRQKLEQLAGSRLGRSIIFTGQVPRNEVPDYLAAMDIASLPQSLDGVGSFRYTTKISEYYAARLPYVTNQVPAAYDLDSGCLWRLPGASPWDERFVSALAALMDEITAEEVSKMRNAIPGYLPEFDRDRQIARIAAFVTDVVEREQGRRT